MAMALQQSASYESFENVVPFPYKKPARPCWQRLVGMTMLNLYHALEQGGRYEAIVWLESLHVNDYVVEVSSLPCPQRDEDRIGKVVAITPDSVIIQTENGQRINWVNSMLLRIPETVIW